MEKNSQMCEKTEGRGTASVRDWHTQTEGAGCTVCTSVAVLRAYVAHTHREPLHAVHVEIACMKPHPFT